MYLNVCSITVADGWHQIHSNLRRVIIHSLAVIQSAAALIRLVLFPCRLLPACRSLFKGLIFLNQENGVYFWGRLLGNAEIVICAFGEEDFKRMKGSGVFCPLFPKNALKILHTVSLCRPTEATLTGQNPSGLSANTLSQHLSLSQLVHACHAQIRGWSWRDVLRMPMRSLPF